jgi:hypothetical protein
VCVCACMCVCLCASGLMCHALYLHVLYSTAKRKAAYLDRFHNAAPEFGLLEKRLTRVATKGVVTLFNALLKHKQEQTMGLNATANADKPSANNKLTSSSIAAQSKDQFLKMLKSSSSSSSSSGGPNQPTILAPQSSAANWKSLDENYLVGKQKMKSWDQDGDSSSSEEGSASSEEEAQE